LAEILRKYRIKHELFNRHKKYKHLRPLYAIGEKNSKISFENAMEKIDADEDLNDFAEDQETNLVVKAWWQFAITCVIKDNR
jgi:hypothetical protein